MKLPFFKNNKKKEYSIKNKTSSYFSTPGKPVWSNRNYEHFAEEAYIKNVVANRCISMIAKGAASVPFTLYKGNTQIENHPILDLLKRPNPMQSRSEFFESVYSYKLLAGNSFIQALCMSDHTNPKELYVLRPDRVTIIAGDGVIPVAYKYRVNGTEKTFFVNSITGKSDILHIKNFHPSDDWYGLSQVEPGAYSIDQHNESSIWNQSMLQNGARPSGALIVKTDGDNDGFLTDEQFLRLKNQLNEEFSGVENSRKPLLLEGGLEWKEMSLSPQDMDFINMKHSSARDIALAFGVPSQLLGIPGDNTYSNLAEARLSLWEQTIIPLMDNILDALNNWLSPMFGSDLEICYDTESISALSIKTDMIWNRIGNANFLSDEEKKKLLWLKL